MKKPAYIFAFDPNSSYIPLTTAMIKRTLGTPRIKAYHITDSKGFNKLQRLQGKKAQISCFTKISDLAGQMNGVETAGGVLVKLDGDEILNTAFDSYSVVDNGGRRWVSTDEMPGVLHTKITDIKERIIKKYLQNKRNINSWIEKHDIKIHGDMLKRTVDSFDDFYNSILSKHASEFLECCDKSDLYKALIDYHDSVEPVLLKYKDLLLNQRNADSGSNYNEVICNNITITKVYVMRDKAEEFKQDNVGWDPVIVDTKTLKLIRM